MGEEYLMIGFLSGWISYIEMNWKDCVRVLRSLAVRALDPCIFSQLVYDVNLQPLIDEIK